MNSNTTEQPHTGLRDLIFGFLLPGVLQGYVFYLMTLPRNFYLDNHSSPKHLEFSTTVFLLVAPAVYFLSSVKGRRLASIVLAVVIGGLCGYLSFSHLGRFTGYTDQMHGGAWWPIFLTVFGNVVVSATVMPYFRAITQRRVRFNHYATLFEYAWNQTVVALIAVFFVWLVFIVLVVAGILFDTVGVDIAKTIWKPYVYLPVAFGSLALGIGITREHESIILAMVNLVVGLKKAILPLHLIIISAFLIYIGITGLEDTGSARDIKLIFLVAISLSLTLCTSAIGPAKETGSRWMSALWRLLSLPTVLITFFAIWLVKNQIDSFGPTHFHLFASLLTVVGFVYSVFYFVAAVLPKHSHSIIQQTNVFGSIVFLVLAVLIQTPLLDMVSYSTQKQYERIVNEGGSVDVSKLRWLNQDAGVLGENTLEKLYANESVEMIERSELNAMSRSRFRRGYDSDHNTTSNWSILESLHENGGLFVFAPELDENTLAIDELKSKLLDDVRFSDACLKKSQLCRVYISDDFDDTTVFALVFVGGSSYEGNSTLSASWYRKNSKNAWIRGDDGLPYNQPLFRLQFTADEFKQFIERLDAGLVEVAPVEVRAIAVGDYLLAPKTK